MLARLFFGIAVVAMNLTVAIGSGSDAVANPLEFRTGQCQLRYTARDCIPQLSRSSPANLLISEIAALGIRRNSRPKRSAPWLRTTRGVNSGFFKDTFYRFDMNIFS